MWSMFKKKQQQELRDICSLSFNLKEDEDVYIECNWEDDTPLTADKYSKLIFLVNSGYFNIQIIKMLEDKGMTDRQHTAFIQQLLTNWKMFYDTLEDKQHNDLVVNPSDFIANVKK